MNIRLVGAALATVSTWWLMRSLRTLKIKREARRQSR